jgi:hypothetical protein
LLGRKLLVLDGIKGDRVVLLEINGELLKVPFLYVLMVRAAMDRKVKTHVDRHVDMVCFVR